jgi:hypothetical protein
LRPRKDVEARLELLRRVNAVLNLATLGAAMHTDADEAMERHVGEGRGLN